MNRVVFLSVFALAILTGGWTSVSAAPLVIAHRGANGYLPEHGAAAYRLAIAQGADYIEPDLVMTKDGVLVARHDVELGATTDVAERPEFADRKTERSIDGMPLQGWFVEDFTFAELKRLRIRERDPVLRPDSARHDGEGQILSLQEVIDIAGRAGRPVGLYIELKHPHHFAKRGLAMEAALVKVLNQNGFVRRDAPVFIECFWPDTLMRLRAMTQLRLTFLVGATPPPAGILQKYGFAGYADMFAPAGMARIAAFADALGPEIALVLPRDGGGHSEFVANAHKAGLAVHAWTLNTHNAALAARLFALGIDGLFADYPDIAVKARGGKKAE